MGAAAALLVAAMALSPWLVLGYVGVLALLSLVFLTVGALLGGRRPANPVGWLLGGWGMRPFALLTVAVYGTLSLRAALAPGAVELYYPEATSPARSPVAGLADTVFGWLLPGQLLVLATALLGGVYAGLVLLAGQLFGDLGDRPPSWAVAGATLSAELLGVVDQTVQPASASLWLRGR